MAVLKKLTQQQRDRMAVLWKRGLNADQIAKRIGCSRDMATKNKPLSVKVAVRNQQMGRLFKDLNTVKV